MEKIGNSLPLAGQELEADGGYPASILAEPLLAMRESTLTYGAVLRVIATARHQERTSHDDFDPNVWSLTKEDCASSELPMAHRITRMVHMSNQVKKYTADLSDKGLWSHQIEPFKSIVEHFIIEPDDIRTKVPELSSGALAVMPPGFGKTLQMVRTAQAIGCGEPAPALDAPIRALVLVPSRRIRDQTIGVEVEEDTETGTPVDEYEPGAQDSAAQIDANESEIEDVVREVSGGFGEFAPGIRVAEYDSSKPVNEHVYDVIVMTYQAFRNAVRDGKITKDDLDVILADEAHHMLGYRTREARRQLCQGEIPVVGFTASDEYSDTRQLSSILPRKVCDIDFRSQIEETGVLPPVQLLSIATESTIHTTRLEREFTYKELRRLVYDTERNAHILDWVTHFANEGRHVLVPCIRGNNCAHSKRLTAEAQKRIVYDPKSDENRPMNAAYIDSSLPAADIDDTLRQWAQGKLDVLFTTGMLGEGWSSSLVDVIVDAAPTTSKVISAQRLGRLTRRSEQWPVKVYVTLIDKIKGQKQRYTPWHVLGEDVMDSSKVIGSTEEIGESSEDSVAPQSRKGAVKVDKLPSKLEKKLNDPYMLIDDLLIGGDITRYDPPEEDFIPVADYQDYWHGLRANEVIRLLQRNGYDVVIARGRRGPMRHVHKDAIEFLKTWEMPALPPKGYRAQKDIVPLLGAGRRTFYSLVEDLGITPHEYYSKSHNGPAEYYSPSQIRRIYRRYDELSTFEPGDESAAEIGKAYGFHVASMIHRMSRATPPITGRRKLLPSGMTAVVVNSDEAHALREELDSIIVTPQNGRTTIEMLIEASGRSRPTVVKALRELGVYDDMRTGIVQSETNTFTRGKFVEADVARQALSRLGVEVLEHQQQRNASTAYSNQAGKPPVASWIPLHEVVERINCTPHALKILLAQVVPRALRRNEDKAVDAIHGEAFSRMTKREFNAPPVDWTNHSRLEKFAQDLQQDLKRPYIQSGDYGLFTRPDGVIDVHYAPKVAQSMKTTIQTRARYASETPDGEDDE